MTLITVIGGTGFAGSNIVNEAVSRGHEVTAISRNAPAEPTQGVRYIQADLLDSSEIAAAVDGADVTIVALSPRGELDGQMRRVAAEIAQAAQTKNIRLGVVGGAGSLHAFEGGPLIKDTEGFPDAFKSEATQMGEVLADLRAGSSDLDWFYVSPAGGFGGFNPGERTGTYRTAGDVLLTDESGNSFISGADFAIAVLDEVESPKHSGKRFTVAY